MKESPTHRRNIQLLKTVLTSIGAAGAALLLSAGIATASPTLFPLL